MRAFVIAMECEADAVRPFLTPTDRLFVSGIGKVNAAAATMKAICDGADEIWNVGVCGGFGEDVKRGEIYGVSRAVEYDFDLAQINHTAIGVKDEYATPYVALTDPLVALPALAGKSWYRGSRVLATGDHFNDSASDYGLITTTLGASLRDMEGAAIAYVAFKAGVKCISFKCVTNVAGEGSMTAQYAEFRKACLENLNTAMREIV